MQDVVLFTRQRGEGPQGTEQQMLSAQVRAIESYASHAHLRIVDRVVEIGISAHEMLVRVCQYLEEHPQVRAIITYSLDRLVRKPLDVITLYGLLTKRNIKLFAACESETSCGVLLTAYYENILRILRSIEYEEHLNQVREHTRKGLDAKAKAGIWPSYAPIGYVTVPSKSGKKCLVRDKQSARSIRRLFLKCASGHLSFKELAAWANHAGLVLNKKGLATSGSAVRRILSNPIYMGEFIWNGKTYKGTHAPIIGRRLWKRVQLILKRKRL